MNPVYTCDRFVLRKPRLSDAEAAADFYRRNRTFFTPFYPTFEESMFSAAAWEQKIRRFHEEIDRGESFRLVLASHDHRLLGSISFVEIRGNPQFECRVGYSIDEQEQGHEASHAGTATRPDRLMVASSLPR